MKYLKWLYLNILQVSASALNGESIGAGATAANAAFQSTLQAYAAAGATPLVYDQNAASNNLS